MPRLGTTMLETSMAISLQTQRTRLRTKTQTQQLLLNGGSGWQPGTKPLGIDL